MGLDSYECSMIFRFFSSEPYCDYSLQKFLSFAFAFGMLM
jgi:hypothetical protein